MKLQLRRLYRKPEYIIGKLYINGEYYCDVVEDRDRGLTQDMDLAQIKKIKVMHETAIPYGTYKVRLSLSPHFKKILPEILNVPGFSGIRMHGGSSASSSSGCLILGKNTIKGGVTNSKYYVNKLIEILKNTNEPVEISITQ